MLNLREGIVRYELTGIDTEESLIANFYNILYFFNKKIGLYDEKSDQRYFEKAKRAFFEALYFFNRMQYMFFIKYADRVCLKLDRHCEILAHYFAGMLGEENNQAKIYSFLKDFFKNKSPDIKEEQGLRAAIERIYLEHSVTDDNLKYSFNLRIEQARKRREELLQLLKNFSKKNHLNKEDEKLNIVVKDCETKVSALQDELAKEKFDIEDTKKKRSIELNKTLASFLEDFYKNLNKKDKELEEILKKFEKEKTESESQKFLEEFSTYFETLTFTNPLEETKKNNLFLRNLLEKLNPRVLEVCS
ncbi:hypothetical protein AB834_05445 [PVC group bacterium (ex Bugula neritina AB1)]|nr:hypothetical protein AB834_05445 [PVC group bacterium (ex Bugula neritina AB1)]